MADEKSLIHMPTQADVRLYGDVSKAQGNCGGCKFFRLQAGQDAMRKQQFLKTLVHDAEWEVRHLGAPANTMGLCGRGDADTLTSSSAVSCDHYKAKAS